VTGLAFRDERWLVVAAVVVVLLAVAYALDFTRRRHLLEKIGHAPQLLKMAQSVSQARRRLKAVLTVLAVALLAVALARPQTEGERVWKQRGIDLVVAIDFSKSMLARDVYPSRIERSKLEADLLLDRFAGDRIALVAFGGEAVRYPLTTDQAAARLLYHGLDPRDMPPGSDLGEAVRTARCVLLPDRPDPDCNHLRSSPDPAAAEAAPAKAGEAELGDRGREIIVLTDGEDTEGGAKAEVERARQLGVEVFFVGVGTRAGARIPEYNRDGELTGWKVGADGQSYHTTRLDDASLKELARLGGGEDHYFPADARRRGSEGLVKALGKLKEGNIEERTASIASEAYHFVLFPVFLLLVIEACISDRRRAARERLERRA
jgi:Ca-activated chloride channel family protein